MSESQSFGEVIGTDSRQVEVECHRLYQAPAFGSFVRADCLGSGLRHFAVVTHVATAPFDAHRVVQAHGLPPGELEQRKPHLASVLRTTFVARVVGYGAERGVVVGTPPTPARLHCFVDAAPAEAIRALTTRPGFLRALVDVPEAPREDLLVATLAAARAAWGPQEQHARLVQWGKYLARLLRQDYVTLESVLERLLRGAAPAPRWEAPLPLAGAGDAPLAGRDPFED